MKFKGTYTGIWVLGENIGHMVALASLTVEAEDIQNVMNEDNYLVTEGCDML